MNNLTFKETISLAVGIYKKSFKITFVLAFMLSFISEYCFVYLMRHGMLDYIESNGKDIPANFPSGSILALIILVIFVATIFVYAMIILLQAILIQEDMRNSDALKLSLQVFSKKILSFIGVLLFWAIVISLLSIFLQYIGMFIAILLFFTVFPAILLEEKSVLKAIKDNFIIIKDDFFYMVSLAFVVMVLMTIKPLITFVVIYFLKSINIGITPLEVSIENTIITLINSFVMLLTFSITIATFLATRKGKLSV